MPPPWQSNPPAQRRPRCLLQKSGPLAESAATLRVTRCSRARYGGESLRAALSFLQKRLPTTRRHCLRLPRSADFSTASTPAPSLNEKSRPPTNRTHSRVENNKTRENTTLKTAAGPKPTLLKGAETTAAAYSVSSPPVVVGVSVQRRSAASPSEVKASRVLLLLFAGCREVGRGGRLVLVVVVVTVVGLLLLQRRSRLLLLLRSAVRRRRCREGASPLRCPVGKREASSLLVGLLL